MFRLLTVRAALVVILVLGAVPAAAGAAGWIAPIHVGGTTGSSPSPAVDANGNAIVGWEEGTPGVIHAARHAIGTPGFASLPNLSTDAANDNAAPVVVLNRSGNGLAAWVHDTGLMANKEIDILALRPNGTPGTLTTVSAGGTSASNITAAINANGDAVVAWERTGNVQAVTRQGGNGTFTNTTTPDTIDGLGTHPVAAIDGTGHAIVVMQHGPTISESHHAPGGAWSAAATLTPSGGHTFTSPDVAASPNGAMVVALLDNGIASFATGSPAVGFDSPTVTPLSTDTATHGPFVTVADNGSSVVGWTTSSAVQTSSRPAGGGFPPAGSVSSIATGTPDDFALGGSGRGDVVVSWSTFDTQLMQNVVRAAVRPAGTTSFGASKIVSNTTAYGSKPQIALDEHGDAVLAYTVGATPAGVDITVFDASAPQVTSLTGPSRVTVGTRASFRAAVTDAFSPFATTWAFGDTPKPTTGSSVTHTFARTGRFTVTVTATDTAGNTATKSVVVTVSAKSPPRCVVPKLKGKTLTQAKRLLSKAHCRLGTVHKPKPRKHHKLPKLVVTKTSPRAGASRPNQTKVALTLGPAPKKTKH